MKIFLRNSKGKYDASAIPYPYADRMLPFAVGINHRITSAHAHVNMFTVFNSNRVWAALPRMRYQAVFVVASYG